MTETPVTRANILPPDPKLDLTITRVLDAAPELIWRAWTVPEHFKSWFCPRPWYVSECDIDLRPAGLFGMVMCGPNGERINIVDTYLDVVPNERLVWTSTMGPGFRPNPPKTEDPADDFPFTAIITLAPSGKGTKYTATMAHGDEDSARKHESLGFYGQWEKMTDQLIESLR